MSTLIRPWSPSKSRQLPCAEVAASLGVLAPLRIDQSFASGSSDLNFRALSIVEAHEKFGETYTDTMSLWDSEEFWRYFRINSFLLMSGISPSTSEAQLWLWLGDESSENNNTEQLLQSISDWYLEDEEESDALYGYTRKKLAPVTDAGIEVGRLCEAAAQAGEKLIEMGCESRMSRLQNSDRFGAAQEHPS